jgi:transcriptional regulator with XRE-family HTH domain
MKYDNIKAKRRRMICGLTQAQLAQRVRISPGMISQFEAGNIQPLPPTMKKIAKVLDLNMEELVIEEGNGKRK